MDIRISIHAPREGGDDLKQGSPITPYQFQSTPPARGATLRKEQHPDMVYISIHAPREGGDKNELF